MVYGKCCYVWVHSFCHSFAAQILRETRNLWKVDFLPGGNILVVPGLRKSALFVHHMMVYR